MTTPTRLLVFPLVIALLGCSGSDTAAPEETAPPPSRASTTDVDELETSLEPVSSAPDPTTINTEAATTTETPASTDSETPTTSPGDGAFLPADLGPLVDSVPGVNSAGEIVALDDRVWIFIPAEADPDDANVQPPLPEDADILAAYGRAMVALYGQVTQDPIPVEPSAEMAATFLDGGQKYSENVFATRNAASEYLGFPGDGDVLRPVVIADPRSDEEAFIFDCLVSGSHYLDADGSLADGEVPGTVLAPLIVRLVKTEAGWIVDDIQDDERACS